MIKEYLLTRLDKLYKELNYKGWDGYGADPISQGAYENTKRVIENCSDSVLECFHLFPGVWGDLSFDLKEKLIGGIMVREDGFTWVASTGPGPNRKQIGRDEESFGVEKCIESLEKIVKFHNLQN